MGRDERLDLMGRIMILIMGRITQKVTAAAFFIALDHLGGFQAKFNVRREGSRVEGDLLILFDPFIHPTVPQLI